MLHNGRRSAGSSRHGSGEEIFSVGHARITEMRVGIDRTGNHILSLQIDDFYCLGRVSFFADRRNFAVLHANAAAAKIAINEHLAIG